MEEVSTVQIDPPGTVRRRLKPQLSVDYEAEEVAGPMMMPS